MIIVGLIVVGINVVSLIVVGMNVVGGTVKDGDVVSAFQLIVWGFFDGLKGDDDGDFDGVVDTDVIEDGTADCNCDGI